MRGLSYLQVGAILGGLVGVVTFFACWWAAVVSWGFLLGVAFGWAPAAIIGVLFGGLTALIWGPVLFLIVCVVLWILTSGS